MKIGDLNRRQFVAGVAGMGVLVGDAFAELARPSDKNTPLYNRNYQTAIGIGDEPISIVDRFGQLKSDDANVPQLANAARGGGSRNVKVLIEIGDPARSVSTLRAFQWLEDGYLPIVYTRLEPGTGKFSSVVFSSAAGGVKADYLGITAKGNSFHVRLVCPTSTSIAMDRGILYTPNQVLAVVPRPANVRISNARFNCLTPERNTRVFPSTVAWEGEPTAKAPAFLDSAFSNALTAATTVEYVFPAVPGKTYKVFLGIGNPVWLIGDPGYFKAVKLWVEGQSQTADLTRTQSEQPVLCSFVVTASRASIRVRSEGIKGGALLSGIWVFDSPHVPSAGPLDPEAVITGALNKQALYYASCGKERSEDIVSSIDLEYGPLAEGASPVWIQLPYHLRTEGRQRATSISAKTALSTTRDCWRALVESGALFRTGVPRFDNLYKSSLLNLFLLRTKHHGAGTKGQDIYVVKPGATIYDSFWYRDGAYIVGAMDAAGHSEEAEKSLRLYTDRELTPNLKEWGQQESGLWESPAGEWDSQGQALWALLHHFELTGNQLWLRSNYENIRRGAVWIKNAIEETKQFDPNGLRPIYWGLLPKGVSEDTGSSRWTYVYEHNFWVALGLQEAIKAARYLGRQEDIVWMTDTYNGFREDLLRSIRQAYSTVGGGQFIPGDPFDPKLDINGDLAAVYPTRFLDPHDPMVTASLERVAKHSREGLYTWFKTLNNGDMWTYMTADWAMCYMLRDDLEMFYRLFNSYVDHAAPTNNWPECIYSESRLGTGDTPHGWAAASYILLHRNSFVYENEDDLDLCWGTQPQWLHDGAQLTVRGAPTRYGKLEFDLKRAAGTLTMEYALRPNSAQPNPTAVRLHIPRPVRSEVQSIRLNGTLHKLSPEESVFRIA